MITPTGLVPEVVDELLVLGVPPMWNAMPAAMREEAVWWQLIRGLQMQPEVIMLGPPTNIEWVFTGDVGEVSAITLRHPCGNCRDGLTRAIDALRHGNVPCVAVAQFSQKYLRRAADIGGPFRAGAR